MPKFKKADRALKALTFAPLANNRYYCKQVNKTVTQKQILGLVMNYHHNQSHGQVLRVAGPSGPPKKAGSRNKQRASKYAQKQR